MASLHYIHAPMNGSKSAQLLMTWHNYEERGMKPLVIKPQLDTRDGKYIKSRALNVEREVHALIPKNEVNLIFQLATYLKPDVVLVDEAQFLKRDQVNELGDIVDYLGIPVMAYGLRADAFTNSFEGSLRLFEIADKFQEFITICPCCGGKAIINMRTDEHGVPQFGGEQVEVGHNYLPVCRKYYKELKEQYDN